MELTPIQEKIAAYLKSPTAKGKIKVTAAIYREIADTDTANYQFAVSHPTVNVFYDMFHRINGYPRHFPLTDKQRFEFEEWMRDLIQNEKILVCS